MTKLNRRQFLKTAGKTTAGAIALGIGGCFRSLNSKNNVDSVRTIEDVIRQTLEVNMGYQPGERVLIVQQNWNENFPEAEKKYFRDSHAVCQAFHNTLKQDGIDITLMSYTPETAIHGTDATLDLYKQLQDKGKFDIAYFPTAFSLSHTPFREMLCKQGCRVASMPHINMAMLTPGGPVDADPHKVAELTERYSKEHRNSSYVTLIGPGTNLRIQIVDGTVKQDNALLIEPGVVGNLPSGDAYCLPGPDTNGYFTVPRGWGGVEPLEYDVKFTVVNNKITRVEAEGKEGAKYVKEHILPHLQLPGSRYLGEFSRGTNHNCISEFLDEHGWNLLPGEKKIDTFHVANGNSVLMGGNNTVPIHIDWVVPYSNIILEPKE